MKIDDLFKFVGEDEDFRIIDDMETICTIAYWSELRTQRLVGRIRSSASCGNPTTGIRSSLRPAEPC